jgi:sodium transport system permease protein
MTSLLSPLPKVSVRGAPHSALTRVFRLAVKELREILRDRRTILTLFAMPILLYPLMSVVFKQFNMAATVTGDGIAVYHVGVVTNGEAHAFLSRMKDGEQALAPITRKKNRKPGSKRMPVPQVKVFMEPIEPTNAEEREATLTNLREKLRANQLDLVVSIPDLDPARDLPPHGPAEDRWLGCKIITMSSSATARSAATYIEVLFAAANEADLRRRLNPPAVAPSRILSVQYETLASESGSGVISLAALVPLILVLMTITGAVYPAIDLTAGERERGTLEILIAAPVSRFELLCAKYFSVVTVAVLTAIVNLVCMTITIVWSGLGPMLFGETGFSLLLLGQVFALLLLFAGFFSAVLLCLTSFARSFKEAQAYLIPLMIASLSPGVMAMMPGLKLQGAWTVLPLLNIILMARDLFEGGVELLTGLVVVMTTILYALAALSLAARVFGAESVLYSEQSSWADMVRRPENPQATMPISMAMWCLALMVPTQFCLMALVQSFPDVPPVTLMLAIIPINLLLFGVLPGLFIYFGRVQLGTGFGLRVAKPSTLLVGAIAGLLLGVSLWPMELAMLAQSGLNAQLANHYGDILRSYQRARESLGWGVLAIVIVPAILEELFFRGLLFNALKRQCNAWITIGVTGLLFGLTHVILDGAIGLERLLPSTLLGLILSTVCWQAGNIWPSMILHVCHNSILLMVGIYDPGTMEDIPWTWLAAGTLGAALGGALLWLGGGQRHAAGAHQPIQVSAPCA